MIAHQKQLEWVLPQFLEGEKLSAAKTLQGGLINATYLVHSKSEQALVLQRVNTAVFTDPVLVMENTTVVTAFLRQTSPTARNLHLLKTVDHQSFIIDEEGGLWRAFTYLNGCVGHEQVESTQQAYEAGKAFGTFLKQLEGLDPRRLSDTIPDFHNTPVRHEALKQALQADSAQRASLVSHELVFVEQRAEWIPLVEELRASSQLPNRITHNDTKISNVLFDEKTNKAVCVIDLDTVMPGTMLYDFGDLVRTSVNSAKEDQGTDAVECRLDIFRALAQGYLEGAGDSLTSAEIEHLVFSAKLITLELGMRFLTDFLNGDTYFTALYANQNLDRARNQFRLVELLEENAPAMQKIIDQIRDGKHIL